MRGAGAITAIGRVIIFVCIVMSQIARLPGWKRSPTSWYHVATPTLALRRDRLGRLDISINNTVFNACAVRELADETLAGIGLFIIRGSRPGVHRDHRRPASYNVEWSSPHSDLIRDASASLSSCL